MSFARLKRYLKTLSAPFRKERVLFYLGMHRGKSFDAMFRKYDVCYGFEANPDLAEALRLKYRRHPHVHIIQAAVAEEAGTVALHISSNDGASSSIGHFDSAWKAGERDRPAFVKEITVPSINLLRFCEDRGIRLITDYVSDIQGMDYAVLATMKPLLDAGRIETITCETTKNAYRNCYGDLPDNSEDRFAELLSERYELVATGWTTLKEGEFQKVPDEWWEMDCKWRRKAG